VLHINVGEALVFQLHLGQLKDQFQVAGAILEADLLDLAHDEGAHLDRVEAKALGEVPPAFMWKNSAFEDIPFRKGELQFGVGDQVFLAGEKVLNNQVPPKKSKPTQ